MRLDLLGKIERFRQLNFALILPEDLFICISIYAVKLSVFVGSTLQA